MSVLVFGASNAGPARNMAHSHIIRDRDDKLCLTDMWKAAGSPHNRDTYNWLRTEPVREFVALIADNLKTVQERIITKKAGKGGATWAHWQIGLA